MKRKQYICVRWVLAIALGFALAIPATMAQEAHQPPKPPKSLRLYVLDCGVLQNFDPMPMFGLKKEEIAIAKMVVPCYLVVDPRGSMMWDTGIIPDSAFKPDGQPVTRGPVVEATKPLLPQLASIGYTPADITYICLSHYHSDHSANVGLFANSTWLVRKIEYDQIFSGQKVRSVNSADFTPLKSSKTVFIDKEDYDVFGDGKVIIKSAPGHTPGHQVLYLKLKHTGGVVIAGDMYHFPEERKMNHFPPLETDMDQARASRAKIEAFVKKMHAQLWMEHDYAHGSQLKKAPEFYD